MITTIRLTWLERHSLRPMLDDLLISKAALLLAFKNALIDGYLMMVVIKP
jgi:hypothetical protein